MLKNGRRTRKQYPKYLADNDTNSEILSRFANGEHQTEIARALGLSFGAVRTRIYVARKTHVLPAFRAMPHYAPVAVERAAWERLRADLVEAHRREFLEVAYRKKAA